MVMAGLGPAIHGACGAAAYLAVDGRIKPGHDD
jgi:hypothetical protein